MNDINELLGDIDGFVRNVLNALESDGIDVSECELDHLCYRVSTQEEYEQYKKDLSELGDILTETEISGRLISTFKLRYPIITSDREIYLVELPSPKKGSKYPSGLEHAEFVIDAEFQDFINEHPTVNFDTRDISKPINPDIRIRYNGFSVKLHHKPLEYVIKHEQ